jgi:hypothetical protein
MRFSPLISLVDEYAFYIYHRAKYDRGFRFIVSLCAEWTDGKWVPSFLERLSEWLNVVSKAVAETSIDGQTVREPNKFEEFGKSNNFYKNISIFLVISLPANLIAFGLLAIIARILEKFQILRWMRVLLRPFRCFLNLWSSILFDNITYLSFHCFLQLSKLVPYSHGTNNFPSCLFCLLTLFAILMTCFLGVPIKLFAKNLFEVDYCRQKFFKSYLLFGTAAAARFATGFFHAYVDLIEFRAFGLFLINSGVVIVVIYCRKAL